VNEHFNLTLVPVGMTRDGPSLRVEGRFGTGGHIGGLFTAREDAPGAAQLLGVVRLGGAPLADVSVVVRGPTGALSTQAGPSGEYEFRGWPGDYGVGIIPPPGVSCGDVARLTLEPGEPSTHDIFCSEIEGAWIISYRLINTWNNCAYGESSVQTTVFTLDGPTLTATLNVATLSSNVYGTCDFHITGHGPPF
jgi:hypothetical protein